MEKYAIQIGEKWLPYREAAAGHFFPIHSSFNKVVNISTDQGLLSVAAEGIGGSSSFLTISGKFVACGAGGKCFVQAGRIQFPGQTINFNDAAVWKGPITKKYRNSGIKKENITAFKAVLDRKAPPQSAWRYVSGNSECRYAGLKAILKLGENPAEALNLIGLGQGLTPAGDDMLVGFLAMVNHAQEDSGFTRELHKIIRDSLHKTADISSQALVNALNGDYHEYIQNCIRDLCEGGQEEVYISAASLMSIGATSGSDIACGMYYGMLNKNGHSATPP